MSRTGVWGRWFNSARRYEIHFTDDFYKNFGNVHDAYCANIAVKYSVLWRDNLNQTYGDTQLIVEFYIKLRTSLMLTARMKITVTFELRNIDITVKYSVITVEFKLDRHLNYYRQVDIVVRYSIIAIDRM